MKLFITSIHKALTLCTTMLALLLTLNAYSVTLTGPNVGCPGSTRQYTISTNLAVTKVVVWLGQYPNNGTLYSERYATSGVPFDIDFPANYQGTVTVTATSWVAFEGNPYGSEFTSLYVNIRVPQPAAPNGGLITACQSGERISLSSLPALENGPNDCYFHCTLEWAGPSSWNFEDETYFYTQGNPLSGTFSNTKLVVPSGVPNGTVGQVSVTAYYSQCSFSLNTSNSANLWYGTPSVQNAYVNGSPAQSFNNVSNGQAFLNVTSVANAASSWTWTIEGGSGYIYPNGSGGSCNVSTSDFVRVVARASNRCGEGASYTFYIQNSSSGGYGYRIAPNPSSSNLSILFNYPELTDAVTSIVLIDEKGKTVKEFDILKARKENYFKPNKPVEWDVRNLPKGRYFLHVSYDTVIEKSQVAID